MFDPIFLTEAVFVDLMAPATVRTATACQCSVGACLSWESLPQERWPRHTMAQLGTLRDPAIAEPTFEQLHHMVEGRLTHYDSAQAPIAAKYFPFNRCDVFKCKQCTRVLLKYTEFGGYFVDQRVRWARSDLVPAPQNS